MVFGIIKGLLLDSRDSGVDRLSSGKETRKDAPVNIKKWFVVFLSNISCTSCSLVHSLSFCFSLPLSLFSAIPFSLL